MGQRTIDLNFSDSIDEFFEPLLSDAMDEDLDADEPQVKNQSRLAELRRRAELRLEEKRLREELNYFDLDWEDT
jgi:hypothetical protein